MFQVRVLTAAEESVVIHVDNVIEVDKMIPILGQRFSEVVGITVIMIDVYGKELAVLHKQAFPLLGE